MPNPSPAAKTKPPSLWHRLPVLLGPFVPFVAVVVAVAGVRPLLGLSNSTGEVFDAGVFALALVAIFRFAEGRLRFDALGMRVAGSAGALVGWAVCFVAILIALRT